jgi:hypothetical protein
MFRGNAAWIYPLERVRIQIPAVIAAATFSGLGLAKSVGDDFALVDFLEERTLGMRPTLGLHFFA